MIDIGRSKRAVEVFGFDDIAIVPTRRTRGMEEVNLSWRIDALTFDFPILAAPMDSVMSPATAIAFGKLGGLGVLNLEGLWTRYADPEPLLEELAGIDDQLAATRRMQEIYAEPIKAELITERMRQIREAGVPVADLCRKHGLSSPTFYKWKAKYGGLDVSEARRLKALEDENAKLKRMLADAMLDNVALKDLLGKKW